MYTIEDLYDLDHTLAGDYLREFQYPWEALAGISDMIVEVGEALDPDEYEEREEDLLSREEYDRELMEYMMEQNLI